MQAINLYHFLMNLKKENDIDFNINTFTNGELFFKRAR